MRSMSDVDDCGQGGYPKDWNIRFDYSLDYLSDSEAQDYHQAAVDRGASYSKYSFCPYNLATNWSYLSSVVSSYNSAHSSSINIFFVSNSAFLEYYENELANGNINPPNFNDPDNIEIFSGCSQFAENFYSNHQKFIIMTNTYNEYFRRLHFPETHGVDFDLIDNHVYESAITLNHEMGHMLLDGSHICTCSNHLMIGAGCTSGWVGGRGFLHDTDLEKIHDVLATTTLHRFLECDVH